MLLVGHTTKMLQLAVCMSRNLHLTFWNEERRLGYEVTSLTSPTNGTGFPLFLHSIGQHGEEQVFKTRSTEAMPQTHGTFAHTEPATLPHCHPHHCPPLYRMIWTRNSTGLSAKHPSPHPTSQFISDLSQNSSCGSLWGKAQRGTRPGACTSVSFIWVYSSTHTLGSLQSHWSSSHWTASHLSSSYGFSFCPHFVYFTCSAGNALKLDICIQELKSSFIKK